ncbi:hypothetical protein AAMO2058_000928200 [Amorphochlora amoebiformis]
MHICIHIMYIYICVYIYLYIYIQTSDDSYLKLSLQILRVLGQRRDFYISLGVFILGFLSMFIDPVARAQLTNRESECTLRTSAFVYLALILWVVPYIFFLKRLKIIDPYKTMRKLKLMSATGFIAVTVYAVGEAFLPDILGPAQWNLTSNKLFLSLQLVTWYSESYLALRLTRERKNGMYSEGLPWKLKQTLADPSLHEDYQKHLIKEWSPETLLFYKEVVLFKIDAERILRYFAKRLCMTHSSLTPLRRTMANETCAKARIALKKLKDATRRIFITYIASEAPQEVNLQTRTKRALGKMVLEIETKDTQKRDSAKAGLDEIKVELEVLKPPGDSQNTRDGKLTKDHRTIYLVEESGNGGRANLTSARRSVISLEETGDTTRGPNFATARRSVISEDTVVSKDSKNKDRKNLYMAPEEVLPSVASDSKNKYRLAISDVTAFGLATPMTISQMSNLDPRLQNCSHCDQKQAAISDDNKGLGSHRDSSQYELRQPNIPEETKGFGQSLRSGRPRANTVDTGGQTVHSNDTFNLPRRSSTATFGARHSGLTHSHIEALAKRRNSIDIERVASAGSAQSGSPHIKRSGIPRGFQDPSRFKPEKFCEIVAGHLRDQVPTSFSLRAARVEVCQEVNLELLARQIDDRPQLRSRSSRLGTMSNEEKKTPQLKCSFPPEVISIAIISTMFENARRAIYDQMRMDSHRRFVHQWLRSNSGEEVPDAGTSNTNRIERHQRHVNSSASTDVRPNIVMKMELHAAVSRPEIT